MSLKVIQSIPVESVFVPSLLEHIIDRKVANLSLNIIEELVDWMFSWFYFPYHQLYMEKKARVHTFADGITPLIDSTKFGVVSIHLHEAKGYISIHAIDVLFSHHPNIDFTFSRETNTDYVVVLDDEKKGPGWFKIVEQEIGRKANPIPMKKCWEVNTRTIYRDPEPRDFFLVEQP